MTQFLAGVWVVLTSSSHCCYLRAKLHRNCVVAWFGRLGSWVAAVIASFGGSYQTRSSKDLIIYITCIPVEVSGEILGLTDRVVLVTLVRAAIKGLTVRKVKNDFRQVSKKLHTSVFSYIKVLHTAAFLPAHSL